MSVFTNPANAARESAQAYITAVLGLVEGRDPVAVLAATGERLRALIAGRGERELRRPERDGKWSLAQVVALAAAESSKSIYEDDPAIVAQLKALQPGQSLRLPRVRVVGDGVERYREWYRNGPGQRDYCNKMPYAADRGTALYAGGNHGGPHRLNDVWEFHLGSNTWHLLYGPDGARGCALVRLDPGVQLRAEFDTLAAAAIALTADSVQWRPVPKPDPVQARRFAARESKPPKPPRS